jgi:acetyl esterase/lipase
VNAGTGYIETFIVQPPPNYWSAPARPLLVVFHKFGVSQKDAVVNTSYFQEAWNRGWYAIAPLGAAQVHFSSIESQVNTEVVLDWTKANFKIDGNRIYGVGFSMGGGAAMNYAARHVDPARTMFAAVVDHSGTVAISHAYAHDTSVGWMYEYWFGDGTPGSSDPWKMSRSSVIEIDGASSTVVPDASLAGNLTHIAMRIVRASNDTIPYLSTQADLLDQHLKSLGVKGGSRYAYYVIPYTGHSWDMLDEKPTCDWLATQTLVLPTGGHTVADHDGAYFDLTIAQDAANAFTPFDWNFDAAQNEFSLENTKNRPP